MIIGMNQRLVAHTGKIIGCCVIMLGLLPVFYSTSAFALDAAQTAVLQKKMDAALECSTLYFFTAKGIEGNPQTMFDPNAQQALAKANATMKVFKAIAHDTAAQMGLPREAVGERVVGIGERIRQEIDGKSDNLGIAAAKYQPVCDQLAADEAQAASAPPTTTAPAPQPLQNLY